MCDFSGGEGAIFEAVQDDERTEGWDHWDINFDKKDVEEDDNYVEDLSDFDEIHEKN